MSGLLRGTITSLYNIALLTESIFVAFGLRHASVGRQPGGRCRGSEI